jgi:hypothetical protein
LLILSSLGLRTLNRKELEISASADLKKDAVAFDQPAEANEHYLLKRSPDSHSDKRPLS